MLSFNTHATGVTGSKTVQQLPWSFLKCKGSVHLQGSCMQLPDRQSSLCCMCKQAAEHPRLPMLQLKASGARSGAFADFDATLVLGRPQEAAPGILFLHGGPHSAYAASYVHSVAFLASLGYNVVVPNYRQAYRCDCCDTEAQDYPRQ